mgnify:FL=1
MIYCFIKDYWEEIILGNSVRMRCVDGSARYVGCGRWLSLMYNLLIMAAGSLLWWIITFMLIAQY